jgi:hypothetical protein
VTWPLGCSHNETQARAVTRASHNRSIYNHRPSTMAHVPTGLHSASCTEPPPWTTVSYTAFPYSGHKKIANTQSEIQCGTTITETQQPKHTPANTHQHHLNAKTLRPLRQIVTVARLEVVARGFGRRRTRRNRHQAPANHQEQDTQHSQAGGHDTTLATHSLRAPACAASFRAMSDADAER